MRALPGARSLRPSCRDFTVGALVEGLPISDGRYVGGEFGWLSPFALLCGVGLCLGYTLLGACWLVLKCEGDVRDRAYRGFRIWLADCSHS